MKKVSTHFWFLIVIVGALLLLGSPAHLQPCAATTVWSDNFNDGDLTGWTVMSGSFTASNNYLESTSYYSMISHSSTTATGTWSFDALSWGGVIVEFICVERGTAMAPESGYASLTEGHAGSYVYFSLGVFEPGSYHGMVSISGLSSEDSFHVDVTRNSTGHFNVFINGEYRASTQDSTHTSSTYFVYHANDAGYGIDNIVVSNTIDIVPPTDTDTSPTDTTPGIPGFPIASIALGAITAIGTLILLRRRRH